MSTTQDRLDRYLAAEARILEAGQSMRQDIRQRQEAELASIQAQITKLQAQLARERNPRRSSLSHLTPVFNPRTCRPEGFES